MATREKTIVYTFPMLAAATDAVVTNFTQITIEIPETVIAFTSVFADVGFQDIITATGGTIAEHRVGLRLGAAAYTTYTELDDISHTAENIAGVIGPVDFTSHFTTNWTGTSMTCDVQAYFDQSTGTTLNMRNVTARVYITYTYNDDPAVNPTQIKTVQIPMESLTTGLQTTVDSQIGTNQIPALTGGSGILPENTVSIVDYAFVIESNETNNTATDFTITVSIDSAGDTAFAAQETALTSARYCRWVHKPSVPDTTTTHTFCMWSSLANTLRGACVDLYITYKFDASATTRLLNSIIIPLEFEGPIGNTTAADKSRIVRDIIVSDKGTITMRQSAVRLHWNSNDAVTVGVAVGGQASRSYTTVGAALMAGGACLQQRIDSGGAQGAGLTLARGRNDFTLDVFGASATVLMTNVTGYIVLNYESDMEAGGPGANTHTMTKLFKAWDAVAFGMSGYTALSALSVAIPETNYWLASFGFQTYLWTSVSLLGVSFDCEYQSTEGQGAGWERLYENLYVCDPELACTMQYFRARDVFRRCPQDTVGDRMDIETSRTWRVWHTTLVHYGMVSIHSTHAITSTVAGTISGHDAGLPTEVRLIDADKNEVMQVDNLAAGDATFSFTVYCDAIDYYVDCYQDNTHVGRSALATAV